MDACYHLRLRASRGFTPAGVTLALAPARMSGTCVSEMYIAMPHRTSFIVHGGSRSCLLYGTDLLCVS